MTISLQELETPSHHAPIKEEGNESVSWLLFYTGTMHHFRYHTTLSCHGVMAIIFKFFFFELLLPIGISSLFVFLEGP